MQRITEFEEVRGDGLVISQANTVDDLLARGFAIRKVIALPWSCGGTQ